MKPFRSSAFVAATASAAVVLFLVTLLQLPSSSYAFRRVNRKMMNVARTESMTMTETETETMPLTAATIEFGMASSFSSSSTSTSTSRPIEFLKDRESKKKEKRTSNGDTLGRKDRKHLNKVLRDAMESWYLSQEEEDDASPMSTKTADIHWEDFSDPALAEKKYHHELSFLIDAALLGTTPTKLIASRPKKEMNKDRNKKPEDKLETRRQAVEEIFLSKDSIDGRIKKQRPNANGSSRRRNQGMGRTDHDSCETAKDIQPSGPGDEIFLIGERFGEIHENQLRVCYGYYSQSNTYNYYKFVGTGNPFLITSCVYPLHDDTTMIPILEIASGGTCDDPNSFECIDDFIYPSSLDCPTRGAGSAEITLTTTEVGVEYFITARPAWTPTELIANYSLRVLEVDTSNAPANAQCDEAVVIEEPSDDDRVVSVIGDNSGVFTDEYEAVCGRDFPAFWGGSGLWYKIDSTRVSLITLSTCSALTDLNGTSVHLGFGQMTGGADVCTGLACFEYGFYDFSCEFGSTLGRTRFVSRPGETISIMAGSDFAFDYGTIELSALWEVPSAVDYCYDELQRRERTTVGLECDCQFAEPFDFSMILTCVDGCEYCDENDSVCVNETQSLYITRELTIDYQVEATYIAGRGTGQRDETLLYRQNATGSCSLLIDGMACTSCVLQDECSDGTVDVSPAQTDGDVIFPAPLLDCTNLIDTGLGSGEPLDFCKPDELIFDETSPLYYLTSAVRAAAAAAGGQQQDEQDGTFGTCTRYISESACDQSKTSLEETRSLSCTCTVQFDGGAVLECVTECGLFCNEEQSVCGEVEVDRRYTPTGVLDFESENFIYVTGREEEVRLLSYDPSGDRCFLEVRFPSFQQCTACTIQTCPDGNSRAGLLNCTNIFDDDSASVSGVIDLCEPDLVVEDGFLEFLSGDEFSECIDFTPPNVECEAAVEIPVGAPFNVNGSTLLIGEDTGVDECDSFGSAGIFFKVVGTGNVFTATTCTAETDFRTLLTLRSGPCDAPNCIGINYGDCVDDDFSSSSFGSTVTWLTNPGETYYLFLSGRSGAQGTYGIRVDETALPPNLECSGATPLTINSDVDFVGSTVALPAGINQDVCRSQGRSGVFYEVVGTGNPFIATTCSFITDFDTVISVRSGTCDDVTCVADNDDGCDFNGGTQSTVAWDTVAGELYYIFISGFLGATGTFGLRVLEDFRDPPLVFCEAARAETLTDPFFDAYECSCNDLRADAAILNCTQADDCPLRCNDEETVCGTGFFQQLITYDGVVDQQRESFRYSFGEGRDEAVIFFTFSPGTPDQDCAVESSEDPYVCNSCEFVQCPNGIAARPVLDCSNFGIPVLDFCNPVVVETGSIFEYFSDGEFDVCLADKIGSDEPLMSPSTPVPTSNPVDMSTTDSPVDDGAGNGNDGGDDNGGNTPTAPNDAAPTDAPSSSAFAIATTFASSLAFLLFIIALFY